MIVFGKDVKETDLGGGVRRKVLAHDESIMTVEVSFDTGAVGSVHTHPHSQISYCVSGSFRADIGGEVKIISVGDSYVVAPNLPHGVVCLSAGTLVDVFAPAREDFLK
ncbi:MAG: cupin domain-containing protein [Clostridia bacterium]|nr:cupin domain-containing protein [Clostridia bacterium]